jgi:ABC-2 type transport system ATP-binding protein
LHAIITESLERRFGAHRAITDLNLEIRQGEIFGLLGPNGAGKTTTMRILACLLSPSGGDAWVCGHDIRRHQTEIRRRVGIMTEAPGLYESLSPLQNLRFYGKLYDMSAEATDRQAEHYLKLFDLWDRRHDVTACFSKGMKQKLSIARALLHDPEVVILDEPTSALDPEGAKVVRDCISSLRGEGRTILLCTHNLSEAQSLCDRVAIIKRTLLRVGTPRELQRSLYGRQVEIRVRQVQGARLQAPTDARLAVALSVAADRSLTDDASPGFASMHSTGEPDEPLEGRSLNDLAVLVAGVPGVGDVVVSDDTLLVAALDPDDVIPHVVRLLVALGADIVRVAEVEYPLERAYLDLVARFDGDASD